MTSFQLKIFEYQEYTTVQKVWESQTHLKTEHTADIIVGIVVRWAGCQTSVYVLHCGDSCNAMVCTKLENITENEEKTMVKL